VSPDLTFAHSADRVQRLHERISDVRDRFGKNDVDARRVNLNNITMATGAAQCTLRLLHWARHGGEPYLVAGLGLAEPAHISIVAKDMLRASKLFLLLEAQFQLEALFRSLIMAVDSEPTPNAFFRLCERIIALAGLDNEGSHVQVLNVPALMRNSMHANGIHAGFKGADTSLMVDGVEFRFVHGAPVECGHWLHITTALMASMAIVENILASATFRGIPLVPDPYAAARAVN